MAERVDFSPDGLFISKPGIDVSEMTEFGKDVVFNSNWAASSRILLSGTINVPDGAGTVTQNYGFTLPFIPVILMMGNGRGVNGDRWYNILNVTMSVTNFIFEVGSNRNAADNYYNMNASPPPSVAIYNDRFVYTRVSPYFIDKISYVVLGT